MSIFLNYKRIHKVFLSVSFKFRLSLRTLTLQTPTTDSYKNES